MRKSLFSAWRESLIWGRNVLSSLIIAYEHKDSEAAEECLRAVRLDLKDAKVELEHVRQLPIAVGSTVRAVSSFESASSGHPTIMAGSKGIVSSISKYDHAKIAFGDVPKSVRVRDFSKLVVE